LETDRTLDRTDGTAELSQQSIAHELEDAAVVEDYLGFEQLLAVFPQAFKGSLLVGLHHFGVADDIRRKNCCKLPVHNRTFQHQSSNYIIVRERLASDRFHHPESLGDQGSVV
jgi:hypothetical protein